MRPLTVIGLDGPVPVAPPVHVAVYEVIADPPEAGAVNATSSAAPAAVAVPIAGGPGGVA